jgi:hypothetical protein
MESRTRSSILPPRPTSACGLIVLLEQVALIVGRRTVSQQAPGQPLAVVR